MSMSSIENRPSSQAVLAEDNRLSKEIMAFCPACKAFETVWFTNSGLNQTRKFTQYGNHIYHDCGSKEPCRLYMTL
jgi:hypothetical protein